jgi:hypothetical protein
MDSHGHIVDGQRAHKGRERPDAQASAISIDKVRDAVPVRTRGGLEARGLGAGGRIVSPGHHPQRPPANFIVDRLVIVMQPREITFAAPAKTLECLPKPAVDRASQEMQQRPGIDDRALCSGPIRTVDGARRDIPVRAASSSLPDAAGGSRTADRIRKSQLLEPAAAATGRIRPL